MANPNTDVPIGDALAGDVSLGGNGGLPPNTLPVAANTLPVASNTLPVAANTTTGATARDRRSPAGARSGAKAQEAAIDPSLQLDQGVAAIIAAAAAGLAGDASRYVVLPALTSAPQSYSPGRPPCRSRRLRACYRGRGRPLRAGPACARRSFRRVPAARRASVVPSLSARTHADAPAQ
jgi:hypothetical protein